MTTPSEVDQQGPAHTELPDDVVEAARARADRVGSTRPPWVDRFVWNTLGKIVAVGLTITLLLAVAFRAQTLLRLLIVSVFFALAIIPAVNYLHNRFGWKRGAAVGVVYAGLFLVLALMVLILIPSVVELGNRIDEGGGDWVQSFNTWAEDTFGTTVIEQASGNEAAATAADALREWGDDILGIAAAGIGLVFNLATIALFTFYFAADADRIDRGLMSRMPPDRQKIYAWVSDTALEQTGGYFYSRSLIMLINGVLFFGAMLLIGMPVAFALPLSAFEAFVATFIPAVGTYIGAAVPIIVTWAVQGFVAALILLVWTIVYQQIENYWLSPRLSAQTMELNGGVAFGAALAGGAIAGPMGAFMSLPVAALITAVVKNLGRTYDVVYHSKYGTPDDPSGSEASDSASDEVGT